jgi:electron transport complex protein RnfG
MKKGILMPIVAILIAAAVLLGLSWSQADLAAKNAQEEHLKLMKMMSPGSENFTVEPYDGEDANIRSIHKGEKGYVIETVTYGYAGEISMFVGVSNEGKVTGLVVRELSETYGLGREALTNVDFLSQFLNSSGSFEVATSGADAFSGATAEAEPAGDSVAVDALTGATVTSKAVVRCVNSAVAYVTGADAVSAATTWGG